MTPAAGGARRRVEMRAAPAAAVLDLLAALDGLQREIQLADLGAGPAARPTVEASVVEGFVGGRAGIEAQRTSIHDQARQAREAGRHLVDLVAEYGAADVRRVRHATAAIAQADDAARSGLLLAPPMTPEQRHLWEWMDRQIRLQVDGGPATAYAPPP
ncbi:MAG TPA: hypothetical protein VEW93_12860 [Acidimicrobiales bacterium]|nr:hypothetical protein [Acidimicrobiales bacterium]